MSFIKNGDAQSILGYFDCDGKLQKCPKCGDKMIIVVVDNSNKLVCEICDINEELNSND